MIALLARLPILLSILMGVGPVPLHPQSDSTARIRGSAASSFNGRPLSGVMIAVPAAGRFVVTDSTGMFVLTRLPAGRQLVRVSYLGRGSADHVVTLRSGRTTPLAVLLDVEAVDLAPIVVEAQGLRFGRSLAGFYDRKRRLFGTFYTPEDLERLRPYRLSYLLRQSGVDVICQAAECTPYAWTARGRCPMAVYLDGWPIDAAFLDSVHPDHVAAVEIYRRHARVPFEFSGPGSGCGVVAVWSRR